MIYKQLYIIVFVLFYFSSIGQIDRKANKDASKNREIVKPKVDLKKKGNNPISIYKSPNDKNISNVHNLDSIRKPNTLGEIFKPNSNPVAKLESREFSVIVPNNRFEVTSLSSDPEDGKSIYFHWKNLPGNSINLKIVYQPLIPSIYFNVELPGIYRIRHVVIDKGKKRDSVDFTIIGIKPTESALIAAKATNSTQQQGSSIPNYSPMAKIKIVGGKQIISLDQLPLVLSSNSIDPENSSLAYEWSIVRGDNCVVESPGSSSTRVLNLKEGDYSFKLNVKDVNGLTSTEIVDITVISSQTILTSNSNNANNPTTKSGIVSGAPSFDTKDEKILPLKGGPEYALLDLVFPGVGHYYTSGDYTGFGKKKYHFITTIVVGTLVASGFYFKLDSEHDYTTYKSMTLEYQKNDLGVLTGGQRGGIESEALKYYDKAKQKDQLFKGLLIGAGVAIVGDAVLTLFKGLINKSDYNRRYKLGKYSLHIDPMSRQYYGVASINLNR